MLYEFHDAIADLQRRFLRVIAEGIGCHETFFDEMVADGPTLTRAIRYPPMAEVPSATVTCGPAEHGDINLITALPRATAPGLQVKVDDDWVDAVAPEGQVIINTGIMLERLTNGVIPIGWHRVVAAPGYEGERYSVVQFCHPRPVDDPVAGAQSAARRSTRSASARSAPPTRSTRCSTRSTSSRTPGASRTDPLTGRGQPSSDDRVGTCWRRADATQNSAGTRSIGTPSGSSGAARRPAERLGRRPRAAWRRDDLGRLPVAVSVPLAVIVQLPLRIAARRRVEIELFRRRVGRHRPRPDADVAGLAALGHRDRSALSLVPSAS